MRILLPILFVFVVINILLISVHSLYRGERSTNLGNLIEDQVKVSTRSIPQKDLTTILLTGDVMLGRTVMTTSLDKKDPTYPFLKVANTLKSEDLVFINLENPIITNCPRIYTGFKFCADPKMIEGLTLSGVDIVNLANNHIYNFGQVGYEETKKYLTQNGIDYVGDDNLVVKEVNGKKFGFIGFNYLENLPKEDDFKFISESKSKVDVLISAVHWGAEYQDKANSNQRLWGKKMINAGVDVIAGSHPHWVQDHEKTDKGRIFYSLGNFIFDQGWSEETKRGLVVRLTYDGASMVKEELLPIYMKEVAQPEFVN